MLGLASHARAVRRESIELGGHGSVSRTRTVTSDTVAGRATAADFQGRGQLRLLAPFIIEAEIGGAGKGLAAIFVLLARGETHCPGAIPVNALLVLTLNIPQKALLKHDREAIYPGAFAWSRFTPQARSA